MERVKKITYKGKEIVYVDYSNISTEAEMLEVLKANRKMVEEDNKKFLIFADYTNAQTPLNYINEANNFTRDFKHLVIKGSFLGITGVKSVFFNGIVKLFNLNFKAFADKDTALNFLVD